MSQYYEHNGLKVARGNLKLGQDTLIINFGPAEDCPSKKLGLCKVCSDCYARRTELFRPLALPYRYHQKSYWQNNSAGQIATDFINLLTEYTVNKGGKRLPLYKAIKYLRFSEAGDFYSQADVYKLSFVARRLKKAFGIVTYGYTARMDLNFKNVAFLVKGSSWDGKNGMSIVRKINHGQSTYIENDRTFKVCPGDCRSCFFCKRNNKTNIAIPKH